MGFYIKDLGMPNRNQSIHIEIKNGKPRVTGRTDTNGYEELDCEIVEVKTPHGDLIDRDAVLNQDGGCYWETQTEIEYRPAVIGAEEEE